MVVEIPIFVYEVLFDLVNSLSLTYQSRYVVYIIYLRLNAK